MVMGNLPFDRNLHRLARALARQRAAGKARSSRPDALIHGRVNPYRFRHSALPGYGCIGGESGKHKVPLTP